MKTIFSERLERLQLLVDKSCWRPPPTSLFFVSHALFDYSNNRPRRRDSNALRLIKLPGTVLPLKVADLKPDCARSRAFARSFSFVRCGRSSKVSIRGSSRNVFSPWRAQATTSARLNVLDSLHGKLMGVERAECSSVGFEGCSIVQWQDGSQDPTRSTNSSRLRWLSTSSRKFSASGGGFGLLTGIWH